MIRILLLLVLVFPAILIHGQSDSLLVMDFNERYNSIGERLRGFKNDPKAAFSYLEALSESVDNNKRGDQLLEIEAFRLKQELAHKEIDSEAFITRARQLIDRARKTGHKRLVASLFFDLSDTYWHRIKDRVLSIQSLEEGYEISRDIPYVDFHLKKLICERLGERYYALTDFQSAIRFLHETLALEDESSSPQDFISTMNTLGLAYHQTGQMHRSDSVFHSALKLAEELDVRVWIGIISGNLGHNYVKQGIYDKGIEFLHRDKEISLTRGAKRSAVGALIMLASLNVEKGKYDLASRQVDTVRNLLGNRLKYGRKKLLFPVLSKLYAQEGDIEMAMLYLDSTLIISDSLARKDNALQVIRLQQRVELEESRAEILKAAAENRRKTQLLYASILGLLLTLGGTVLIVRQKRRADQAKRQSDELLLNILPEEVAEELKRTGASQAKKFTEVTVMFCDFENFTGYSENMAPEQLVKVLNEYFAAFDRIVVASGLEKIKTVGDAYICVCGLPEPDPDHAKKVVEAAIKMQMAMQDIEAGWNLRVGIHTGPVVAGIVGTKKFAYDVWGDTVNTAARMEQNAEPGTINISEATYNLIRDNFTCTHRGKIQAKNKGMLDMYYVEVRYEI